MPLTFKFPTFFNWIEIIETIYHAKLLKIDVSNINSLLWWVLRKYRCLNANKSCHECCVHMHRHVWNISRFFSLLLSLHFLWACWASRQIFRLLKFFVLNALCNLFENYIFLCQKLLCEYWNGFLMEVEMLVGFEWCSLSAGDILSSFILDLLEP